MIIAFTRAFILYFLIMIGLRLMGKRQIGELEPSELVLTMMISDLAAVPMQDFGIPLLAGVIPILTLLALSMLISQVSLHHLRLRSLICGDPAILIHNGKIQQETMRKNRYTLDELMEEIREQGYCSVEDIKYAVLENSGQLSVLPWPKQPGEKVTLPVVLINDGRVLSKNMAACHLDEDWLARQLKKRRLSSPQEVFLMTIDEEGSVFYVKKENVS